MRVVRQRRPDRFTVLDNRLLADARLSYRARGVLAYLLSLPDGWHTDAERIAAAGKEGRDAIRAALAELERVGYLVRDRQRDADTGRWATLWIVRDDPATPALKTRAGDDQQKRESPQVTTGAENPPRSAVTGAENPPWTVTSEDDPSPQVITSAENPTSENQALIENTDTKHSDQKLRGQSIHAQSESYARAREADGWEELDVDERVTCVECCRPWPRGTRVPADRLCAACRQERGSENGAVA